MGSEAIQAYDAGSSRPCLACGHAVPHNDQRDYEGPGDQCSFRKAVERYPCDEHKRWRKSCQEEGLGGGCWTYYESCEHGCDEATRTIADLTAHIHRLTAPTDEEKTP